MPAGVNKGMAVAALAQRLGIGPESVMALGDYDNDVSMLSYAGVSVAMANASERARAAADTVPSAMTRMAWPCHPAICPGTGA